MSDYIKQTFQIGQVLKASQLNYIEEGIAAASRKPKRIILMDEAEIVLRDNIEYVATENINTLTISMPDVIDEDFRCSIDFSSGDTATTFVYPENFLWTGDNININKQFVPVHNYRYHIDIWFDGVYIRANASGVMIL